jgi:hypothetical protein
MFAACVMLEHSMNVGENEAHVQFGTIRKTRSALSNSYATTANDLSEHMLIGSNKGVRMHFSTTPMYSLWFDRFVEGCHTRMGDE